MNKVYIITIVVISLLLAACSDETANSDEKSKKETDKNKQEQKEKNSDIPKAPGNIEATLSQEQGVLIEDLLDKKKSMDEEAFEKYYEETFMPEVEEKVGTYAKKHADASAEQLYNYLVYSLGSTGYAKTAEKVKGFTPKFEEPEFPTGSGTVTTKDGKKVEKKSNAVLLIDSSGSMKAKVGGETQMEIAKEAIGEFAKSLPDDGKVSLLVYGHVGTGSDADKKKSCAAIETMYKLGNFNSGKFSKALNSFSASGWTPLAGAIKKAKKILKPYEGKKYENTVYIVSDGVETCGGDPVKAAKSLAKSNIKADVNIIGFDVDNKGQRQLKKVAEAGNGDYVTVRSKEEFTEHITEEWSPSLISLAWIHKQKVGPWEEMDEEDRLDKTMKNFINLSEGESKRISDAIEILATQEPVKQDRIQEIRDLQAEMNTMRQEYIVNLKEKKAKEIDKEVKRIEKKVDEWKAQWDEK